MPTPAQPARTIVFGVTAHGLGHLTRSCQLANALVEIDPRLEFHFWCDIPRDRIAADLNMPFQHRAVPYEPGTAQRNCFELDIDQTVSEFQFYIESRESRIAADRDALRLLRCEAVICDVPAMLVRAASDLHIPTVAVSNFTWDWILDPILTGTAAEPALALLRDDYRNATHHIQLPFGPRESPISSNEMGPLISRRASLDPSEVKGRIGIRHDEKRPIALVCPGGWNPDGWQKIQSDAKEFALVLVGDLPVTARAGDVHLSHALPDRIRFPDLVNTADVVLAKPGYGIASECVSHRTPLVTVDRPRFRETDLLRRDLARLGPCAELSLADFFAGRWKEALVSACTSTTLWAPLAERPDLDVAQSVLKTIRSQ